MELSIFLAKVIGWLFVIMGIFLLARQKLISSIIEDTLEQPGLLFILGFITLVMGLLLVVSHNMWTMSWPVIITIIAWLTLLGGIFRLFSPDLNKNLARGWLKKPTYIIVSAIIYIIIGLYLLSKARICIY